MAREARESGLESVQAAMSWVASTLTSEV